MTKTVRPWPALWALVVGFFMILIDTTIVSIANPKIMEGLHTDINSVIWVTSAYLLTYAVPLLVTGRLGDRFGPKNLYLIGLVVFTLASAWCGFSGDISQLITARAVQGLGAAMMTPQTMAVITRIFPPDKRGQAMGLWGATSGVAMLVGPVFGGFIVDSLGWEWIFFVNVPIGIVAFILAWRLVPKLETHPHRFDIIGVVLSAIGMFLLVFGLQEGQKYKWGTITGVISVWSLIIAGIIVLLAFVIWQRLNKKGEPLLPLPLFRDRNFALANGAISAVGFTTTGMSLPLVFYFQLVLGYSPTQSALMLIPMAVITAALAQPLGRLVDRVNPRYIAVVGSVLLAGALAWYSTMMVPGMSFWWLLLPSAVMGVANACIWSPISTTATRNLPQSQAGAGAGVYNTTRQVGSVLGSAAIAALIQARLTAELPGQQNFSGTLPSFLHEGFSAAMAQSLLLPAAGAIVCGLIVLFFAKPKQTVAWTAQGSVPLSVAAPGDEPAEAPVN